MVMGRWKLRPEPYKPNPVDADNDGIVQEQTIWERPAGTRFITEAGEAFLGGLDGTDASQLQGLRLVNEKNEPVDYEPSFRKEQISLGETFGTLGSKIGTLQGKPVQPEKVRPSRAPEPRLPISPRELADLRREYPDLFDDEGNLLDRIRDPRNPERYFLGRPVRNELEAINTPDELETYLKGKTIVSFDVETLGKITPEEENDDRIIQLGAVIYKDGEVVARFNKWIAAPWDSVGDWVRNNVKTNDGDPLTQEFLDSQQSTKEVLEEFFAWFRENTGGGPPVLFLGQNVEFDMLRLRNEVNRTAPVGGFTLDSVNSPYVDTQLLFKNMQRAGVAPDGQSSSLNKLRQFLGIRKDFDHHQADQDAEMTGDVLWALVDFLKVNDPDGSGTRRLLNVPEQNVAEQRSIEEWEAKREQYVKDKADLETVKALLADVKKNVSPSDRGEGDVEQVPLFGKTPSQANVDEALIRAGQEYTEKVDVESPDFMADNLTPEEQEGLQEQASVVIDLVGKAIGGNRGNPLDQSERDKEVPNARKKIHIDFKNEYSQNQDDELEGSGGYTVTEITDSRAGYINLNISNSTVVVEESADPNLPPEGALALLPSGDTPESVNPATRVLSANGAVTMIHELMHNEEFIGGSYAVYKINKVNNNDSTIEATFATKEEAEAYLASKQIRPNLTYAVMENPVEGLTSVATSVSLQATLKDALFEKDIGGPLIPKELPTEGYLKPEYKTFVKNYQSLMVYLNEAKNIFSPSDFSMSQREYDKYFEQLQQSYSNKFGYIAMLALPDGEKYIQSESAQNIPGLRVMQSVLATDLYSSEVSNLIPDDPDLIIRNQIAKVAVDNMAESLSTLAQPNGEIENYITNLGRPLTPQELDMFVAFSEVGAILQVFAGELRNSTRDDPYNEFFSGSPESIEVLKQKVANLGINFKHMQDWDGSFDQLFERTEIVLDVMANSDPDLRSIIGQSTAVNLVLLEQIMTDPSGNAVYRTNYAGNRVRVPAPFFNASTRFSVENPDGTISDQTVPSFEISRQGLPKQARDTIFQAFTRVVQGESLDLQGTPGFVMSSDYYIKPEEIWARTGVQFVLLSSLKRNGVTPETIERFAKTIAFSQAIYTNPEEITRNLDEKIEAIAEFSDNPTEVAYLLRIIASQAPYGTSIYSSTADFVQFDELVAPTIANMLSTDLVDAPTPALPSESMVARRPRGLSFDLRATYGASVRQQFKPTRRRSSDGSIVEMAQFPSDAQINAEVNKSVQEFIEKYPNPPIPLIDERGRNTVIFTSKEGDDINTFRQQVVNLLAQDNISDDDKVALVNYLQDTFSADNFMRGRNTMENRWPEELRGDNFDWAGLADVLLKSADRLAEANSKEVIEKRKLEAQDPFVTIAGRVEEIDDMKVRITTSGDNPVERILNVNRRPERFRWLEVVSERFDRNPDVTSVDDRGNETINEDNATKLSKKFLEDEGILGALNRAYTAGVTRDERLGELRVALQELDAENANNGKSTNHVDDIDSWINVVDDALAIEGGAYGGLGPKALTRAEVEERDAKIRERLGIDPNAEIPKGSTGPVKSEEFREKLMNTAQGQFIVTDTIEGKNDEVKRRIRELGGFWDPEEFNELLPDNFNELGRREQVKILKSLGYGEREYDADSFSVNKPKPAVERLKAVQEEYESPLKIDRFRTLVEDPNEPDNFIYVPGGIAIQTVPWDGEDVNKLEHYKRLGWYDRDDPERNKLKDWMRAEWIMSELYSFQEYDERGGKTRYTVNDETLKSPRFIAALEMRDAYYDKLINMTPEELFEEVTFVLDGLVNNDDTELRVELADLDKLIEDGFYKNTHFRQLTNTGAFKELKSSHSGGSKRVNVETMHGVPRYYGEGEDEPSEEFTERIRVSPASGYLFPKDLHSLIAEERFTNNRTGEVDSETSRKLQNISRMAELYSKFQNANVVLKPELRERSKLVVGDALNMGSMSARFEDATPEELFNFFFTSVANKGYDPNLEREGSNSGGGLNRLIELLAISDAMKSPDETKARVAKSIPLLNLQSQNEGLKSNSGNGTDITKAGFTQAEADFFSTITGDAGYFEVLTFGNWDMGDVESLEVKNFNTTSRSAKKNPIPVLGKGKVLSSFDDSQTKAVEKRTVMIDELISSGKLSPEATEKFLELKQNDPEQYYKIIENFDLSISPNSFEGGLLDNLLLRSELYPDDPDENVARALYEENGVSVLLGLESVINYPRMYTGVDNPTLVSDLSTALNELAYAREREEFADKIRSLGEDIQIKYKAYGRSDVEANPIIKMEEYLNSGKWKTLVGMPEFLEQNPSYESTFPDLPVETQWRLIREAQALKVIEAIAKEDRVFDSSQNPDISDLPADMQNRLNALLGVPQRVEVPIESDPSEDW